MPDDNVTTADSCFVDIIRKGDSADAAPAYPCPTCGRETKPHHTPSDARICSNRACRQVLDTPELVEASRLTGLAIQPVQLLCPACGSTTKEHHTPPGSRICVGKGAGAERHILAPGTFEEPRATAARRTADAQRARSAIAKPASPTKPAAPAPAPASPGGPPTPPTKPSKRG